MEAPAHLRLQTDGNRLAGDAAGAVFSLDGRYRYRLWRRWEVGPRMLFVMLNPSTADALKLDPTIRRCMGFARREGMGSLEVVNLFGWRSTDPKGLSEPEDPVGPDNDDQVRLAMEAAHVVVAAYGQHQLRLRAKTRAEDRVLSIAASHLHDVKCLGQTAAGSPRHPLYVRGDTPLVALP